MKARCRNCKDIIESKHTYDFVTCKCFRNEEETTGIFVDGGDEYGRFGGNIYNFELLDESNKSK